MATRKRAAENALEPKELLHSAFQKQVDLLSKFSGMTDKTWQLYKLSPLHKFSSQKEFLKKAAAEFSGILKSKLSVNSDDQRHVRCSFTPLHNNEDSQPYICVTVLIGTTARSASRMLVVMCPGPEADKEEFMCYPMLLVKGPAALSQIFLSWLTECFDSYVSPLMFSPIELCNLAFLWMLQENNRALELQYGLPSNVPELKNITVTLQPDVIRGLTEAVDETNPDAPKEANALRVLEAVHVHFDAAFRVNLNALHLTKLSTSLGIIGADGRLKISSSANVEIVLESLTALQVMRNQQK